MSDVDLIGAGYEGTVRSLFSSFFTRLVEAGGNSDAVTHAEQAFKQGLSIARDARDRASKIVGS